MKKIIVGTRGSLLAVRQTEIVIEELKKYAPQLEYKIVKIKTTGDMRTDISLREESESVKKMFVKEIEKSLLDMEIDIAVHSMKDIPEMAEGLIVGAVPKREDARDVFISDKYKSPFEMPKEAVIGTGSIRREVQIKKLLNDIEIKEIRGNIHTRIEKMGKGEYDALILAAAGLKRAGLEEQITYYFDYNEMVPSPAQGAICVQCRENDAEIINLLSKINDAETLAAVTAERHFSKLFNGGCKVPIGAYAEIIGKDMKLTGMYSDGEQIYNGTVTGNAEFPIACAEKLFQEIKKIKTLFAHE